MSTLIRETNPEQGRIPALVPQHLNTDNNYVATGEGNPLPVLIKLVKGMLPVQFQETLRTQLPVQTHTAVPITSGQWGTGQWIELTGYDKLALTVNMALGVGMTITVDFSHDGTTYFTGIDIYDGTALKYSSPSDIPVIAKYGRLAVKNKDTTANATKTTNAYMYLKS